MSSSAVRAVAGARFQEQVSSRSARIVSMYRFLASPENTARTTVLSPLPLWLRRSPRLQGLLDALLILRQRSKFDVAIALGNSSGMIFAALQRLIPGKRLPTVLVECNWYREKHAWHRWLKHRQMRFSLGTVDRCVVWAEREMDAYSREFGMDRSKFVFLPQHLVLHRHRYRFTIFEGDYIFAAGNVDRDFRTFVEAVKTLNRPCIIACSAPRWMKGVVLPPNVRHVSATPEQFRQLMAGSMIVVVPMQGGLLHSGGQQGFINAMGMGKPVVVSDPAGACSYIEHGVTGMLVPPSNPPALREALEYLLADNQRRREMGERARQVAEFLTVENVYDRICAIADEVARAQQA